MLIKTNNLSIISKLRLGDLLIVNKTKVYVFTQKEFHKSYILLPLNSNEEHLEGGRDFKKTLFSFFKNEELTIVKNGDYLLKGKVENDSPIKLKDIIKCDIWDSYFIVEKIDDKFCLLSINNFGDKQILKNDTLDSLEKEFLEYFNNSNSSFYGFKKISQLELILL